MGTMGSEKKRIAVIGGGISGLGAAYLLRHSAELTVYERNSYIGGHSRTVDIEVDGKQVPVDTGFIVYNERNYPFLSALFEDLSVPVVKTDMSFGVSIGDGWLEFGSAGLWGLFGSVRNVFSLNMWKMVLDILKFNKRAMEFAHADPSVSLKDCLDSIGVGDWFRQYFILPMGGSIWSCPIEEMLQFPAASFIRFFNNHGLLTVRDHPQWYSVLGGSREYVQRILEELSDNLVVKPTAERVERDPSGDGVTVYDSEGGAGRFDEVIFATHADVTMKLLENPQSEERSVLSSFRFKRNEVVLHKDTSFMPRRRSAWSSWVYQSDHTEDKNDAISLSYWMNNLQALDTDVPVIVTLNPSKDPVAGTEFNRHSFSHPMFDEKAIRAQERIRDIQGRDRLWFCGAWQRNGFHEDGLWSAVEVVRKMGVDVPWE
jgi:predicted NAD/FAD-binding protein